MWNKEHYIGFSICFNRYIVECKCVPLVANIDGNGKF